MTTKADIENPPLKETVGAKILIVDDDETVLRFLSALLSSQRYVFETAQNGIEAIEKVMKFSHDIILLDIFMPKMDGIEACRRLKENFETQHIPIIVFTVFDDKDNKLKCLKAGANEFITKPLDSAEILMRIRNLLQLKDAEDIRVKNEILTETIKAVENAKREWELTMDCISDIVILIDIKDTILRCNKILTTVTGKSYSELLGEKWQDVLKKSGFTFRINHPNSIEYHHPAGKYFIYEIYYLKKIENSMYAAVITLHDITERKQVEETLEHRNKELEKAYTDLKAAQSQILQQEKMASIGQLAAGVAHEINNPVGFIMSNLGSLQKYIDKLNEFIKVQSEAMGELSNVIARSISDEAISKNKIATPEPALSEKTGLLRFARNDKSEGARNDTLNRVDEFKKSLKIDYITDDISNLIKESLEGAERVKKIVQDLKSFSRVDESEHKSVDINAGIESTINIVWNELKYKATVKKKYGDIPPTKCKAGQLNQVFMNILVNAAHAIERQGEITVKTWHENNDIFVSISDTGHGIPADKINRIFEPFFTTKEVGKGTGLGLSIAYDIIKKHNGDIMVESEVGKGSRFTVKIPIVER